MPKIAELSHGMSPEVLKARLQPTNLFQEKSQTPISLVKKETKKREKMTDEMRTAYELPFDKRLVLINEHLSMIDKAVEKTGSASKVATALGVSETSVNKWQKKIGSVALKTVIRTREKLEEILNDKPKQISPDRASVQEEIDRLVQTKGSVQVNIDYFKTEMDSVMYWEVRNNLRKERAVRGIALHTEKMAEIDARLMALGVK